jgi:SAM-dependent methyltransferase
MTPLATGLKRLRHLADRRAQPEPHPDLVRLTDEDRRYLTTLYDDTTPLPPDAADSLRPDHPDLLDLRERYGALDLPVTVASRWSAEAVASFLDLRYFRGETLITWHYRELPRISTLKYFIFARYVDDRDPHGLLRTLGEDGAFGCWTFSYPGYGVVSRDLLESTNEITFLDRQLDLLARPGVRLLDIGAGYGRLAHRMAVAHPRLGDYCCIDAIPESTFISRYYLRARKVEAARVVPLDEIESSLGPGTFDLAINIHSFSECTFDAVQWWVSQLERLEVPAVLIVPNEADELLTLEVDGSRRDFRPLLERAGYRLAHREPVIDDAATRGLLELEDHFFLFERIR